LPTAKLVQIEAWSFSRWKDYETCPALAKFKHIEKRKEPGNAAMDRGTDIHTLAERFANGKLKDLPKELETFSEEFKELVTFKAQLEQDWAFDANWQRTGWFDKNAWLRIKMDAHYMVKTDLFVIDHKTGKPRPEEHKLQLELYVLGGMLMYPDAKKITAKLWYLDQGVEETLVVTNTPQALVKYKNMWINRTRAMLNDTRFAPRPGNYCRWCYFRKDNNGPCQF
jgi:hypothetical protein